MNFEPQKPNAPIEHRGELVGSRYRIAARIGAGGMGVVYRAEDEQLHRPVAIKILPEDVRRDGDRLARFKNEARALAALNHPNIVTIYEVGVADDVPFIAMELVEGQSLREGHTMRTSATSCSTRRTTFDSAARIW